MIQSRRPGFSIALLCGGLTAIAAIGTGCATVGSPPVEETRSSTNVADPCFLRQYAETYRFGAGRPTSITPTPQGDAVLFLRSGPRSNVRDLYSFDVATGQERVLLTAEQILNGAHEELTDEEKARRERMRISARGITSYRLSDDGEKILVPLSGDLYLVDRAGGGVKKLSSEVGFPIDPQFSPDGARISVVHDNDLYVMDTATGVEIRLTTRHDDTISNGVSEFVAQEEMSRFHGSWWSPDGAKIAYQRTDESAVEVLRIMDPTRPDKAPTQWRYPRPGKPNASVELGILTLPDFQRPGRTAASSAAGTVWVQWGRDRYPYLATVKWSKHGPLTILVQNRTQTEEVLLAVNDETGYTSPLLTESDQAWINLDQDMPLWLPDNRGFLWTTERNGAWQLEHRAPDGAFIRMLTSAAFGYRGLSHYQEETDEVVVQASDESTETHLWRIPIDPTKGGPRRRTMTPGVHSAIFGKSGFLHVHSYQTADGEEGRDIIGEGGNTVGSLTSIAEEPTFEVNIELAKVGEAREYDAYIIRPRNFSLGARYPVIVSVYAGPHSKTVMATPNRYFLNQWFADHGFVVVQFDGRGTPNKGRAWERAIKGDLIAVPLHDQVEALRAMGAKFPEMDLERVGIYGWSFGGYFSAHAALQRGDVYHAAVAGAPVTDWLDYDTHYTERYMGLPDVNAEGYRRASALTYADRLERPLMIVHGTADDNVYFMHSLKLTGELFRSAKKFEFVPMAGFTHMVAEPEATDRLYTRIIGFFERELK